LDTIWQKQKKRKISVPDKPPPPCSGLLKNGDVIDGVVIDGVVNGLVGTALTGKTKKQQHT